MMALVEASKLLASSSSRAPSPWRHMPFWAEQRQMLTRELEAMLKQAPEASYALLLAQPPSWLGGEALQGGSVGNALKSLYLHLWIQHLRGQIRLTTASTVSEGFMGVLQVHVPSAARPEFDRGLFPTPSSCRLAESRFPFARKTLQKLWQSAGLVMFQPPVCDFGDAHLRFDDTLRLRLRAQIERADTQRYMRQLRDEEERLAKRPKVLMVDAEVQTEPNLFLAHTETFLLGALSTLRQAQQCAPSEEEGSF